MPSQDPQLHSLERRQLQHVPFSRKGSCLYSHPSCYKLVCSSIKTRLKPSERCIIYQIPNNITFVSLYLHDNLSTTLFWFSTTVHGGQKISNQPITQKSIMNSNAYKYKKTQFICMHLITCTLLIKYKIYELLFSNVPFSALKRRKYIKNSKNAVVNEMNLK